MFYLIIIYIFLSINLYAIEKTKKEFDLTIVGPLDFSGSLTRLSISLIDMLKNDLRINYITTSPIRTHELSEDVKKVIRQNNKIPGKVCLFTDILAVKNKDFTKSLPNSPIKIAYSMFESTRIPQLWVKLLNEKFNAVIVPDKFLIEVYIKSGVKIPIFVLPIPLYLNDFLNKPLKKSANEPFVFGCSAVGWKRKNLDLLIKAFAITFANNKNIILKIHTKDYIGFKDLNDAIKKSKAKNIHLIFSNLSWQDYIKLLSSFDCYVLLSKGEGFSITPRESLALGIPCIITNNTGHKTICDTNLVYNVKSELKEVAYYELFNETCGEQFNCKIEDVIKALKEVCQNYNFYLNKAKFGRSWAKRYLPENLKSRFLHLIKKFRIK